MIVMGLLGILTGGAMVASGTREVNLRYAKDKAEQEYQDFIGRYKGK